MQWCNHSIEIWDCENSKVWFQFIFHIVRLGSVLLVFKPYFCLACFAMAAYSVACQCNRHQSALAPAQVDYTHFQHLLLRVIRHLWCQLYWLQTDRNKLVLLLLTNNSSLNRWRSFDDEIFQQQQQWEDTELNTEWPGLRKFLKSIILYLIVLLLNNAFTWRG